MHRRSMQSLVCVSSGPNAPAPARQPALRPCASGPAPPACESSLHVRFGFDPSATTAATSARSAARAATTTIPPCCTPAGPAEPPVSEGIGGAQWDGAAPPSARGTCGADPHRVPAVVAGHPERGFERLSLPRLSRDSNAGRTGCGWRDDSPTSVAITGVQQVSNKCPTSVQQDLLSLSVPTCGAGLVSYIVNRHSAREPPTPPSPASTALTAAASPPPSPGPAASTCADRMAATTAYQQTVHSGSLHDVLSSTSIPGG